MNMKIELTDIISDSWRYPAPLNDSRIAESFLFSVPDFSDFNSRLYNLPFGIRIVNRRNREMVVGVKIISEVTYDFTEQPIKYEGLIVEEDSAGLNAIKFCNTDGKCVAVWIIPVKHLIVYNEDTSENIYYQIIKFIYYSLKEFFTSNEAKEERRNALNSLIQELLTENIFSLGGDPEFEVIDTSRVVENKVPAIIQARDISLSSTDPEEQIGSDSTTWQVELRPTPVTFSINSDPEEVADACIREAEKVFSKYSSSNQQLLSAFGQYYFLGHHIHIGSLLVLKPIKKFVQILDVLIGIPLRKLETEVRKLSRFGKDGDVETKRYGFEYRTPNAVWAHPNLLRFVVKILVKLIQKIASKEGLVFSEPSRESIMRAIGFDEAFISDFDREIQLHVDPDERIDVLGNWAVKKSFPSISWKFPYKVREILLDAKSKLKPVFLVSKDLKARMIFPFGKEKLLEPQINRILKTFEVDFEFIPSTNFSINIAELVSSNNVDEDLHIRRPAISEISSVTSDFPPILGLSLFILPATLPLEFYKQLVEVVNAKSI